MATTQLEVRPVEALTQDPAWIKRAIVVALLIIPLVAHIPLLLQHAEQMWQRPHYRFFPLALLGAVVLAYVPLSSITPLALRPGRPWVVLLGMLTSWTVLVSAEIVDSPWLACVAAMIVLPTLIYSVAGSAICRQLWRA